MTTGTPAKARTRRGLLGVLIAVLLIAGSLVGYQAVTNPDTLSVTVASSYLGQTTNTIFQLTIHGQRTIDAVATLIATAPAQRPGPVDCPYAASHYDTYRLTFSWHGIRGQTETIDDTGCEFISQQTFWILPTGLRTAESPSFWADLHTLTGAPLPAVSSS